MLKNNNTKLLSYSTYFLYLFSVLFLKVNFDILEICLFYFVIYWLLSLGNNN